MKTKELSQIVNKALKLNVKNPVVPILENFYVKDGKLILFTLETAYQHKVDFEGEFLVPAKKLQAILRKLKDSDIELQGSEEKSSIWIDGKEKFKFSTEHIQDYPKIPECNELYGKLTFRDVYHMQNSLRFTSDDELMPSITGVFLNSKIVATDGHRMTWNDISEEFPIPVIVPKPAINLMDKVKLYPDEDNQMFEVWYDDIEGETVKHLRFVNGDEEIITKTIDERYPDFESVIPKNPTIKMLFYKGILDEAINLALLGANETTHQISLEPNGQKVKIHSENVDFNYEFNDEIDCEIQAYADTFKFGLNGKMFLDTVKDIHPDTPLSLGVTAPNQAILINDNILQMPVMLI